MYTIYCDGVPLWAPAARDTRYIVLEPKLRQEINRASVLTFKLPLEHAAYNSISLLTSTVYVYDDGVCIFIGRPLSIKRDFWNNKLVTCEDALAWLGDAVVSPYSISTKSGYISTLSNAYNSQASANRKITFADTASGSFSVESDDYTTVLDEYIDVWLPGIIQPTSQYDADAVLTYAPGASPEVTLKSRTGWPQGQTIQFGKNLLDLEEYLDGADLYTVIVPLGKIDTDTGRPLTVASVNSGSIFVESADGISAFGRIVKAVSFPDIETASELLTAGQKELAKNIDAALSLTLTVLDLRMAGADAAAIRIGELSRIYSPPHGYDSLVQCKKIELDMGNPEKSKYSFGVMRKALTRRLMPIARAVVTPQNLISFSNVTPSQNNTVQVTDDYTLRLVTTANAANRQATVDVQLEPGTTYRLTCSATVSAGTGSIRYKEGSSSSDVASQTMKTLVANFTADRDISVTFTTGATAYLRFYFYNTGATAEAGDVTYADVWVLEES